MAALRGRVVLDRHLHRRRGRALRKTRLSLSPVRSIQQRSTLGGAEATFPRHYTMPQSNGRGAVDVNAATLLLADTPTVLVNDRVAVVGAWARPATVASVEQAATLIFDRAPANPPIDCATPTNAASTSSAVRYVVVGVAGHGGMGTVHVAQDLELLRHVALT